jgi:hypothetical protein
MTNTRECLERIPGDNFGYNPHAKSFDSGAPAIGRREELTDRWGRPPGLTARGEGFAANCGGAQQGLS